MTSTAPLTQLESSLAKLLAASGEVPALLPKAQGTLAEIGEKSAAHELREAGLRKREEGVAKREEQLAAREAKLAALRVTLDAREQALVARERVLAEGVSSAPSAPAAQAPAAPKAPVASAPVAQKVQTSAPPTPLLHNISLQLLARATAAALIETDRLKA